VRQAPAAFPAVIVHTRGERGREPTTTSEGAAVMKRVQTGDPPDLEMTGRPLGKVRENAEREHILSILQLTGGSRAPAARILGISRKTLWKKLKQLGVSWPPDVTKG
jgi:DNA-binding NtrC family response regulator